MRRFDSDPRLHQIPRERKIGIGNRPRSPRTRRGLSLPGALTTGMEWLLASALVHRLRTLDVQIHNHGILPASDDHCFARHIWAGITFLMGDVGRNVNEISRICLIAELQTIAPAHAGPASHDVDHRLKLAVMVGSGFRVGLNHYSASPQLAGACTHIRYGGSPRHSGSLGCVGIQFPGSHNFHAVLLPVQCVSPCRVLRDYERSIPAPRFRRK